MPISTARHSLIEGKYIPEPNSGCWLWEGHTDRNGYGTRRVGSRVESKNWFAHRLSYTIHCGEIPEDVHVLHKCDNPSCINPDHLFLGTHDDNMQDMAEKDRNRVPHPNIQGEKHFNSKLTEDEVRTIRSEYIQENITQPFLANKYGVSLSTIRKILSGELWKYVK